ncbi:hypothetical protein Bbelb_067620 [Branchiostoma belcheri]|nr:hypothetical protein Bbelb_067620 [Branchiostoma belcheri]
MNRYEGQMISYKHETVIPAGEQICSATVEWGFVRILEGANGCSRRGGNPSRVNGHSPSPPHLAVGIKTWRITEATRSGVTEPVAPFTCDSGGIVLPAPVYSVPTCVTQWYDPYGHPGDGPLAFDPFKRGTIGDIFATCPTSARDDCPHGDESESRGYRIGRAVETP